MENNINNKEISPNSNYILIFIIAFVFIALICILFDFNITSIGIPSKSEQEIIGDVFLILFFCLLIVGLCIILLPNLREFKNLFEQINNVIYVIIYTIFTILFYTLVSKNIINNYSNIINIIFLVLGICVFYSSINVKYIENITYERIKMMILLFCFITLIITFYNINPGNASSHYFGYSLLLTIIISVFAFLYLIILLTLPNIDPKNGQLLNNFSNINSYGSILFLLFLIIVTTYISYNKDTFFSNKAKSSCVIILILVISILSIVLLSSNVLNNYNETYDSNKLNLFKHSLLILFGLLISGLIIYWITYNIENLSSNSSIVSFILNLLIVALIIGLIYKTFQVKLPHGNNRKNAFFYMLLNILFYIPCIIGIAFDNIGSLISNNNEKNELGSYIMLFIAFILFAFYFTTPSLINKFNAQGGKQLVNYPVNTDVQYNLGNYEELNDKTSATFDYQYAISCWIFIDSAPPNTSPSYNKYTSLLNFGNKPNILYNAKEHKLMVTMQQKDLKNITKNKLIDFDENDNRIIYIDDNILLQKWNNIIVNYNGGTLDIFLNGKLVKSSIEVIPYYTIDKLTIGDNNGIKGGICNVIYFNRPLNSSNIYYLYNLVKKSNPPLLYLEKM